MRAWSSRMICLVDGSTPVACVPRHFVMHGRTLEAAVRKVRKILPKQKKGKV